MKRTSLVAALSLSALLAPALSLAQSPAGGAQTPKARPRQPKAEADPLAEIRRTTAISLITSLADEARSFRDETLRARVQARAADALWETDQERARSLFRRAWDAADAADREAQRRGEEERRRQREQGGPAVWMNPPNLRSEVLRLASRRERALGEEFLAKLEEARKQQLADASLPKAGDAPRADTPENELMGDENSHAQRLSLARQLLEGGDVERALQFATPALQRVSRGAIRFLTDLRGKNPAEADKIYAALVARAASDPVSDANTVSALSSYLFSPQFIITIDRGGSYSMESAGTKPLPENVPEELRRAFFQMAASILMRPLPPADQDRTTSGRVGTYFMIGRLLPLFERHAPAAVAPLRAQMAALTPDVPPRQRNENEHLLTEGLVRDDQPRRDDVQAALDKLSRASTPAERDRALQDAAFAALARGDARAREFAERVEDRDARAQLLSFIDYDAVSRALTQKDAEAAFKLARDGALTHVQRVWAYTEAAKLLAKDDRGRAVEILDEAAEEARRIDAEDADRPRAMLAVLTPLFELDAGRVWSHMPDLVKAVNAAPAYTGEDGRIVIKFQTRERASIRSGNVDAFNLQPIFSALARDDMNRAVDFAKSFTGEGPRASATLAVAAAVLKEPAKPRPSS
ncbi:MAG TPA: hypothetical protein VK421_21050 [Pyrinomonadaceae bacterium]|nr:hypothetical protein [Pyrinomonadaceae bacterium]